MDGSAQQQGRRTWSSGLAVAFAAAVLGALLPFGWTAASRWLSAPDPLPAAPRDSQPVLAPTPLPPLRELALVVPGTLAASESWFTQSDGHVSFASMLGDGFRSEHAARRAAAAARREAGEVAQPGDAEDLREREFVVRRLLWDSSFRQSNRSQAARQFAHEIERQAAGFDRVHLIGHSHGGNVILASLARMTRRVDTVVTLATPHLYFQMARSVDGSRVWVPLCAPPDLPERTGRLLNVRAPYDFVSDDLATWINGSTEAEGLDLTRAWQDASQELISANDHIVSRLVGTLRVRAAPTLSEEAFTFQEDLVVPSLGGLGTAVHSRLHGTRVGQRLGRVLAGAPAGQLRALLLDESCDAGDLLPSERHVPEPAAPRGAWIARVELVLDPSTAPESAGWWRSTLGLGDKLPDPGVRIGGSLVARAKASLDLAADVAVFVPDGPVELDVVDVGLVTHRRLGPVWTGVLQGGRLPELIEGDAERPWTLRITSWPVW